MKKLINFRPITFLAAFISAGIASAYFFIVKNFAPAVILIVLSAASLIVAIIYGAKNKKLKHIIILIAILIFASATSAAIFSVKAVRYENASLGGMTLNVTGRVKSTKSITGGYALELDEVEVSGAINGKTGYNMCVYSYGDTEFEIGSVVNFTAGISDRTLIYDGRFSSGAFASGIKYYATINEVDITVIGNRISVFERINLSIKSVLFRGLEKDEFGVAYALLCGNSDFMDEEVLSSYRDAGVAHVFAVSGLHIGFLAAVIGFFAKKQKRFKWLTYLFSAIILFGYSGICGFTVSSIRAAVMSLIFIVSYTTGNAYDVLSSISLAAALILLVFPEQLLCVGFELSFSVVLGITLLGKPISLLFRFLPNKISQAIGSVISAQLFSLPICLYAFGRVSFFAIFANMIFIPIVGVIFISLIICVILGAIFSPTVFLFVHNYVFKGVNFIFTSLNYAPFLIGGFTLSVFAFPYYCALIVSCGVINLKRLSAVIISVAFALIVIFGTLIVSLKDLDRVKFKVIGGSGLSVTYIDTKNYDTVFICSGRGAFSVSPIKRLFSSGEKAKADLLVVLNSARGNDVAHIVSRVRTALEFNELVYPEDIEISPELISKNFPSISVNKLKTGDNYSGTQFDLHFSCDGYAAICNIEKHAVSVASYFPNDFGELKKLDLYGSEIIVTGNYSEQINFLFSPTKLITYRKNDIFVNGEEKGAYIFALD